MPQPKHLLDMARLFHGIMNVLQNDLTTAITVAAYIEEHITALIREKMPGLNPKLDEKLFGSDRSPISTLSAKIHVARALDAVDEDFVHDALYIGKIRNKFAHDLSIESFDDPRVSGLIANLKAPTRVAGGSLNGKQLPSNSLTNRELVVVTGMALCGAIVSAQTPEFRELEAEIKKAGQGKQSGKD